MPQRNVRSQLHPAFTHFTPLGRGRVYGIFEVLPDVQACTSRLLTLGLADSAVQVLIGEDGEWALDDDGHRHGVWARLVRLVQGITDERQHVEQYARALCRGEVVLSVDVSVIPGRVPEVARAFRESGAHFVHHYGTWVVQELGA